MSRGKKTDEEKNLIPMLRDDPQMRTAFINKIAAPIANKMFECGLLLPPDPAQAQGLTWSHNWSM